MRKNRGFTWSSSWWSLDHRTVIGLLLPALASPTVARSTKDSSQINQTHKGMLIFANSDKKNRLPIPGIYYPNGTRTAASST